MILVFVEVEKPACLFLREKSRFFTHRRRVPRLCTCLLREHQENPLPGPAGVLRFFSCLYWLRSPAPRSRAARPVMSLRVSCQVCSVWRLPIGQDFDPWVHQTPDVRLNIAVPSADDASWLPPRCTHHPRNPV